MASGDSFSWHNSKEFRQKLQAFHDKKAAFPKEGLAAVKSLEQTTLLQLRDHMKTMKEFKVCFILTFRWGDHIIFSKH